MTTHIQSLKFTIKRTPNDNFLIMTGLWTLGWLAALGTIVFGLITDDNKQGDGFLIFVTIVLTLAGLFVSRIFLWHLRGKEIVEKRDDEFKITHDGTIFPSTSKFEFSLIENFKYIDNQKMPRWVQFWGLSGGHIEFEYLGQKKYFGQTIEYKAAKEIISRLVDCQKTTTH